MAGEKKRRRIRRSRYVETLNRNQISPTTPPQTTLDQSFISIDTDRNLDLDLRQTGSRSIDQPRSDPDSENRRSFRSPQRRPSFRSATPPQEADRPIRIRSTSPLPPPPYIRQAASTLTPPTAPNHDNINIVAHVGIYLPVSVFTHGQYVAMSRVKSYYGLQFALAPPSENSLTITSFTNNIVFKLELIL